MKVWLLGGAGWAASLDGWMTTDPSYVESLANSTRAISCGLAVALDTLQPCPSECARACGMALNSAASWSMNATMLECAERNHVCVAPLGLRTQFRATEEHSVERRYIALAGSAKQSIYQPFKAVEGEKLASAGNVETVSYHRALVLNRETLSAIGNPLRMGYASLKMNNRIVPLQKGEYCGYVRVGRPMTAGWQSKYFPQLAPEGSDLQPMYYDGAFMELRDSYRIPREQEVRTGPQAFVPGMMRHTPTIHPMIQQWYLRYAEDEDKPGLAVTVSRSYPAYEKGSDAANRQNEAGENVNTKKWDASETDSAMELETFTTLSWAGLSVAPMCAERNNCAACTASGVCAWCDMSNANLNDVSMWGGWHSAVKSRQKDGSACGVPPHICAMMGGTPSTELCPITWKDEWDVFLKYDR